MVGAYGKHDRHNAKIHCPVGNDKETAKSQHRMANKRGRDIGAQKRRGPWCDEMCNKEGHFEAGHGVRRVGGTSMMKGNLVETWTESVKRTQNQRNHTSHSNWTEGDLQCYETSWEESRTLGEEDGI